MRSLTRRWLDLAYWNVTNKYPRYLARFPRKFSTNQDDVEDFGNYSVILPEEPFIFGVSHIQPRRVPGHILKPPYALTPDGIPDPKTKFGSGKIKLGGEEESRLRAAAQLAKKVKKFAGSQVKVGVTTDTIDSAVHDFIVSHSVYPSPLHYQGYPRSCCTSINNIIVHGIPDDRPLENGDIINIDITLFLNGYHGDTSETFLVGDVDEPGKELIEVTNTSLERAIAICEPGRPFKAIGDTIHEYIRDKNYSVSSQFTGHGIGSVFHSPPWIIHSRNDEPGVMEPGHCFTIEPAIIQGRNPRGWIFPDGWAASTENCARSAQAEHMVLITENGADVLTR
ncbi:methionyl aminopeptidase [Gymnopilus junonius]|uniref:Methionine aminopeptidase n=1 Tax=Gymnopilus junonius TaxID=109634 RepID=A0A9P5NJJ4_GYMJU|nr:methionyl aminopeptidase [Gymnopilus junonius]